MPLMCGMAIPFQLRRRRRAGPPSLGLAPQEGAHLRYAFASLTHRLSDQQLRFSGPDLLRFLVERGALMGIDPGDGAPPDNSADYPALLRTLARPPGAAPAPTALDARITWLADRLKLDAHDGALLALFARNALFESWRALAQAVPMGGHPLTVPILGLLGDVSAIDIESQLESGGRLLRSGLIEDAGDGDFNAGRLLKRIARAQGSDPDRLSALLMPVAPPSTLQWDDFAHLGPLRDLAVDLLHGARRAGQGVSLLLHGAPGTGKSEFARALADRLGWQAVIAGAMDEEGGEPHRSERLAHLNILRGMTAPGARRLIIVDEADDLFLPGWETARNRSSLSKYWMNQLVENPGAAIIWLTNDARGMGESIVRRMTLALRFDLPTRAVRERVLRRQADAAGLALDDHAITRLSALPAAPAVLASAASVGSLTGSGLDGVQRAGESILTALGKHLPPKTRSSGPYDPALSHADTDLEALAQRLSCAPERGWSLLLSGPSGTGKSAFAQHLGARLGIDVEAVRASDLLSPYVGETEARISAAFRRCGEAGTLLLLDEADSFLFDRQGATRSWESGMVNEMLRSMEALRAPFIATTNLIDRMDPATQRRFTLRVSFQSLPRQQAAALFARYFNRAMPEPLAEGLTPGDFAVVAHRARLLGEARPAMLYDWLLAERDARGPERGRMGFCPDGMA